MKVEIPDHLADMIRQQLAELDKRVEATSLHDQARQFAYQLGGCNAILKLIGERLPTPRSKRTA